MNVKIEVITNPEFIARIQAKSERAPERDTPGGVECWRDKNGHTEHYFVGGAYWHSLSWIPGIAEKS